METWKTIIKNKYVGKYLNVFKRSQIVWIFKNYIEFYNMCRSKSMTILAQRLEYGNGKYIIIKLFITHKVVWYYLNVGSCMLKMVIVHSGATTKKLGQLINNSTSGEKV